MAVRARSRLGSKAEQVARLGEVPLFAGLSKRQVRAILDSLQQVHLDAGHDIVQQGEPGMAFYLILEGEAVVKKGGRKIGTLGPGDWFGELALLDAGPRRATVTATSPLRALRATRWEFKPLLERHPQIAVKMLTEVARRLSDADPSPDVAS